jgi:hypothetical protein
MVMTRSFNVVVMLDRNPEPGEREALHGPNKTGTGTLTLPKIPWLFGAKPEASPGFVRSS